MSQHKHRRPFRKGSSGHWQFEYPRNRRERRWIERREIEREASGMGIVPTVGETSAALRDRVLDAIYPERVKRREEAQAKYGKGSEVYWMLHKATAGFMPSLCAVNLCLATGPELDDLAILYGVDRREPAKPDGVVIGAVEVQWAGSTSTTPEPGGSRCT
jgi:hypothetical protein